MTPSGLRVMAARPSPVSPANVPRVRTALKMQPQPLNGYANCGDNFLGHWLAFQPAKLRACLSLTLIVADTVKQTTG
jgi:hypothetical protein